MRKIVYLLGLGVILTGAGCFSHDHNHDHDYRGGAYDDSYHSYGRGAYDDDHHWTGDQWEHHDFRY